MRSAMNTSDPLSTPTSTGSSSRVVGGDLGAELGDPFQELRLADDLDEGGALIRVPAENTGR